MLTPGSGAAPRSPYRARRWRAASKDYRIANIPDELQRKAVMTDSQLSYQNLAKKHPERFTLKTLEELLEQARPAHTAG